MIGRDHALETIIKAKHFPRIWPAAPEGFRTEVEVRIKPAQGQQRP